MSEWSGCTLYLVYKILLLSSCVLWHLTSGKGDKGSDHPATVALERPFALYSGHFGRGLGHSMVRVSI
jgi:hypothetical protein